MQTFRLTGLVAAPFTPLSSDGELNLQQVERMAGRLVRSGVKGAFICGTTGEGQSLMQEQRKRLAERWVEVAGQDLRVVVHVGHLSAGEARDLAAHAARIKVAAIAAVGPSFFRPATAADLATWCAEVASAAPQLPFYYYHIPALSGVNVRMWTFLEAAQARIPNLAGVKFTSEDLLDFQLCRDIAAARFDILAGRDEILLSFLALGAQGAVGSTYNYAASLYRRIWDAFAAGDLAAARDLQMKSARLVRALVSAGGGVPAGKAIMKLTGLDCGPCRAPLAGMDEAQLPVLRENLEAIGFFDYCEKD